MAFGEKECKVCGNTFTTFAGKICAYMRQKDHEADVAHAEYLRTTLLTKRQREEADRKHEDNKRGNATLIFSLPLHWMFGGNRRYCCKECADIANKSAAEAFKKEKTFGWRLWFFVRFWFVTINILIDAFIIYMVFFVKK